MRNRCFEQASARLRRGFLDGGAKNMKMPTGVNESNKVNGRDVPEPLFDFDCNDVYVNTRQNNTSWIRPTDKHTSNGWISPLLKYGWINSPK